MIGISVKTRVGYNKVELDQWIPEILKENPDALIIHARTMKEMSKVPARWEHLNETVAIRNEIQKDQENKTLILGNGDVKNVNDALEKIKESGADGAMLGRAIFGNPWLFSGREDIEREEKMKVLLEHTYLFEELLGDTKSFALMKKHFKSYLGEFHGAKEVRIKLMETNNAREVEEILKSFNLI